MSNRLFGLLSLGFRQPIISLSWQLSELDSARVRSVHRMKPRLQNVEANHDALAVEKVLEPLSETRPPLCDSFAPAEPKSPTAVVGGARRSRSALGCNRATTDAHRVSWSAGPRQVG